MRLDGDAEDVERGPAELGGPGAPLIEEAAGVVDKCAPPNVREPGRSWCQRQISERVGPDLRYLGSELNQGGSLDEIVGGGW